MIKHKPGELVLGNERRAGVGLHITSLPGHYGIGEIGQQAHAFIDTLRTMGLSVWQFLPLGPTAYGDSPYQPFSTFAGNELMIDIDALLDQKLLHSNEVSALTKLPTDVVDYGKVTSLKMALLKVAASRFAQHASSQMKSDYDQFVNRNETHWLHDYALFRILKTTHDDRPWPQWAPQFTQRENAALNRLQNESAERIEHVKIIQFLFHDQWQKLRRYAKASGVRLFGDMPIYIALDSADAWANREILKIDDNGHPDYVGGVPPDYFSEDGQLWGNPLYDWHAHAASGYQWWIDRLRASIEQSDIVRIDHFRGFESYWSIPSNATTAKDGAWEPGPGDAIFNAMKNTLGALPIVAEDLGVITPQVEALRDRHQLPGMAVLQFQVTNANFNLNNIRENCVCYTGTHDNDTTTGWFLGGAGDARTEREILSDQKAVLNITKGSAATVSRDLIDVAFASKAKLAVAPLQDYLGLGSTTRFNTPGSSNNNWRWRVTQRQITHELCQSVAQSVGLSGRD